MSPQTVRTLKSIAIPVLAMLAGWLILQVVTDGSRIAVLETQMTTIERNLETNRVENNAAHEKIGGQLTELLREVAKK